MELGINLKVINLDDGDGFIHFEISISNGQTKTDLQYYNYDDAFKMFGEKLSAFPTKITDKIDFQIGEENRKWAYYLFLEVYCYEPNGQSAIKVIVDNHDSEPYYERSEFSIRTFPASLNKLGQGLKTWDPNLEPEFVWKP